MTGDGRDGKFPINFDDEQVFFFVFVVSDQTPEWSGAIVKGDESHVSTFLDCLISNLPTDFDVFLDISLELHSEK